MSRGREVTAGTEHGHVGSNFDDFLAQDGLLAEVEGVASERVISWRLEQEMKRAGLTSLQLASRADTSCSAAGCPPDQ